MILSISGPSSTGKTTLLHDLANRWDVLKKVTYADKFELVKETARDLFSRYYGDKYSSFEELLDNDRDILDFEFLVADDQITSYYQYDKDMKTLYLCDRCPLDTMVYLSLNYQYASPEVRKEYRDKYLDTLRRLADCYANVNIKAYRTFPFDEAIEEDGFRPMQYTYRRQSELIAFDMVDTYLTSLPSDREMRVITIVNDLLADDIKCRVDNLVTEWNNE